LPDSVGNGRRTLTVGAGGLPGRAQALEAVAGVEASGAGGAGVGGAVVAAAQRAHVAAVAVARGAEAEVGALVRQAAVVQQLVHPLVRQTAAAQRARVPSNKQTRLAETFTIVSMPSQSFWIILHEGDGVQHTQKSKFYTKNIKNKKAWFSTQSNIIYFKKK